MNTLVREALACELAFDEDHMIVHFTDGRRLYVPLLFFPRLMAAAPEDRMHYEISGGGTGLHWDELDEDIDVASLLMGVFDRTRHGMSKSGRKAA